MGWGGVTPPASSGGPRRPTRLLRLRILQFLSRTQDRTHPGGRHDEGDRHPRRHRAKPARDGARASRSNEPCAERSRPQPRTECEDARDHADGQCDQQRVREEAQRKQRVVCPDEELGDGSDDRGGDPDPLASRNKSGTSICEIWHLSPTSLSNSVALTPAATREQWTYPPPGPRTVNAAVWASNRTARSVVRPAPGAPTGGYGVTPHHPGGGRLPRYFATDVGEASRTARHPVRKTRPSSSGHFTRPCRLPRSVPG